jgi:hypothetical protein
LMYPGLPGFKKYCITVESAQPIALYPAISALNAEINIFPFND